jgi:adenylate cyclase, class 2
MSTTLEREIKLKFPGPTEARSAIMAAGGTPLRGRRLQEDCLLDTDDKSLQRRRSALRVRIETGHMRLTFKGPVLPSTMKLREEYEVGVSDGEAVLRLFEQLGYSVCFRYQKYREEYSHEDVTIALDETPIGTFVEIEGSEKGIMSMAASLGRPPSEFIVESYRSLFLKHRQEHGTSEADMLFEDHEANEERA